MEIKRALITGVTGQDGSYLAEFLLAKGYEVWGIIRRSSSFNTKRVDHIFKDPHTPGNKFHLVYGDLTDSNNIERIMKEVKPHEVYNLGAQSHVRVSFDMPNFTTDTITKGTMNLLESIKNHCPSAKYYQASSSEMFGKVKEIPQTEDTPFHPRSPYGCAKVYSHWLTVNYRESYDLFACNGILFNHESERRGRTFVTRKISEGLAKIKKGQQDKIFLGNLDAKRDWGYAPDYIEAMWLMLQQERPCDYVVATGETHSVREFLEETAKVLGLNIKSNGKEGLDEKYVDENGKTIVEIDPKYYRPAEVDLLLGNPEKIMKIGWTPRHKFEDLVRIMAMSELNKLKNSNETIVPDKIPNKSEFFWPLMENNIDNDEVEDLISFLRSTDRYTNGPKVREFESLWSSWQGCKYSVFVNSGSSANLILVDALKELYGLSEGDKIIVPAITWATNIAPIIQANLKPIFVDVNLENFSFDLNALEKTLEENPDVKGIFVTHLLGFPANIKKIKEMIINKDIKIFEDCCESHGSEIDNIKIGNFGEGSSFSFYYGHHATTIEGGMVCTNNYDLYKLLLLKRSHGLARELPKEKFEHIKTFFPNIDPKFLFLKLGYNVRNTELGAVLGINQLKKLDEKIKIRNKNFKIYKEICLENIDKIYLVQEEGFVSSFAFPFIFKNKEMLKNFKRELEMHKIEYRPIVGGNLLLQPFLNKFREQNSIMVNSNIAHENGLYLGNGPHVNQHMIKTVGEILKKL